MYYCGKFSESEKKDEYARKGVAKRVRILPEGRQVLCDVEYNEAENTIDIVQGNKIVILTDTFGVREDTEFEFIPVKDGVLLILDAGCCYVHIKDMIVSIDATGNVNPSEETIETKGRRKHINKIYWLGVEDLRQWVGYKLNALYNVPIKYEFTDKWFYNSVFKCIANYGYVKENPTFSFTCTHAIAAIGCDELPIFEPPKIFKLSAKTEQPEDEPVLDEEEEEDDEYTPDDDDEDDDVIDELYNNNTDNSSDDFIYDDVEYEDDAFDE